MSSGKLTLSKLLRKVMSYASVEERIRAKKKAEELKKIKEAEFRSRVQNKRGDKENLEY